ncbi:glucoamylase glam [Zopfochytrium polystomum]|nr:glucoamylase glam [Zopfochytrium polystomum]
MKPTDVYIRAWLAAVAAVFATSVVNAANEVKVTSYAYDGAKLTGNIKLSNIAYQKSVAVNYADLAQKWGYSCPASYNNGPDSTNYEYWTFSCSIGSAGISQFYVQYNVSGTSYYDNNGGYGVNYQVTQPSTSSSKSSSATTTSTPTTTATTKTTTTSTTSAPTSTYTGGPIATLSSDISSWLAAASAADREFLLANIHPAGTIPGIVVAAVKTQPSGQNYFYHWIRDASLVMEVVRQWYSQSNNSTLSQLFFDHRDLTHKIQNINAQTGLGEAKFNVDGTDYTGGWCRPQNDGPAFRASVFMRFANNFLANGGSKATVIDLWNGTNSVIKPDLEYVSSNFNDANGCDLWEEQRGLHFFTMMGQRRALLEGATFANTVVGDTGAGAYYKTQAAAVESKISSSFFSTSTNLMVTTINGRQLDSAIPLGVIHGYNNDGFYSPTDDRVLASMYQFAKGFSTEYALNGLALTDSAGLPISYAIGRYYGDTYNGLGNSQGNPWFLCTLSFAEVYYRAAKQYIDSGSIAVTSLNQPFFVGARPAGVGASSVTVGTTYQRGSAQFNAIVAGLVDLADTYVRRVKKHAKSGYHLNEQYSRADGTPTGVDDLTWSYASLTTANNARQALVSAGYFSA